MTSIKKHDAEIHRDVLDELRWDTRVDETDVGVEVDAGVVTLTGTVSSWAKKVAAEQAAHRVTGVLDVANDVEVRLPGMVGRSDTDVAMTVRRALEWDAMVPDDRICTTVSDGVITLSGTVEHAAQRADAEQCIRNLHVVRGIINRIEVRPAPVPPEEILRSIESALERHAERQTSRVQLSVEDGRVTVSGTVRSWSDHRVILGAVIGTRGVRSVDDHLRVNPAG